MICSVEGSVIITLCCVGAVNSSAPCEPLLPHLEGAPALDLSPSDSRGLGVDSAPSPHSLCDLASDLPSTSFISFPLCEMGTVIPTIQGYCEDLMRLPQREADAWAHMTRQAALGVGGTLGKPRDSGVSDLHL